MRILRRIIGHSLEQAECAISIGVSEITGNIERTIHIALDGEVNNCAWLVLVEEQ